MEAARIDWERIESVFVEDGVYENINAPQWLDLSSPLSPSDDVAWFCRPDCKHPTTADDFVNSTPASSSSKLLRSVSVSKLIGLVDWTRREAHLKKRGGLGLGLGGHSDAENQDPNFSTPNRQIHYLNKAAIKSSAGKEEEDEYYDIQLHSNENTQSGKDLLGGSRELFGKMTEFCTELKKMATRPKEEDACNPGKARNVLENKDSRLPLVEVKKDTYEAGGQRSLSKKKNKIKRGDGDENIPVTVCVNLNNVKRKEEDKLMVIRTNPPTPQGFSAAKTTKATNTIPTNDGTTTTTTTLDVFWFLKPCTTLST